MKKGMATSLALMALMGVVAAQTTVSNTWSGSGNFASTIDASGAQKTTFSTSGAWVKGSLDVVNQEDNPYNYGVPTVSTYLVAEVGGGNLNYVVDRLKSKESMYGVPGQVAYTSAYADGDSLAEVATGARSNYANMGVGTYAKPKTSGGYNFQATGAGAYGFNHGVVASDGDGGEFILEGTGTAGVNAMSSDIGASSFKFGKGQGCYTNANVVATGSGMFQVNAAAGNQLQIDAGDVVVSGPATYNMAIGFGSGLTYGNFALSGN